VPFPLGRVLGPHEIPVLIEPSVRKSGAVRSAEILRDPSRGHFCRAVRKIAIKGGYGGLWRYQLARIRNEASSHARIADILVCGREQCFVIVRADEIVEIERNTDVLCSRALYRIGNFRLHQG
jgi:hypothetical protein